MGLSHGTRNSPRKMYSSTLFVGALLAAPRILKENLTRGRSKQPPYQELMTRIHLLILWHMHQPQYRDPSSGQYVLPWTRLHALKDYFGMVRVLKEFPSVHATFNAVPALGAQLEEYASGLFREPWFDMAFRPTVNLSTEDKAEILVRAFQVNRENLMSRWPRFVEL